MLSWQRPKWYCNWAPTKTNEFDEKDIILKAIKVKSVNGKSFVIWNAQFFLTEFHIVPMLLMLMRYVRIIMFSSTSSMSALCDVIGLAFSRKVFTIYKYILIITFENVLCKYILKTWIFSQSPCLLKFHLKFKSSGNNKKKHSNKIIGRKRTFVKLLIAWICHIFSFAGK